MSLPYDCPAATGTAFCRESASRAHRCVHQAEHVIPAARAILGVVHECRCGHRWTCLKGSLDDYDIRPREAP